MSLRRLAAMLCSTAFVAGCPSSPSTPAADGGAIERADAGSMNSGGDGGAAVVIDAGQPGRDGGITVRDAGGSFGTIDGGLWGTLTPAASPLTVSFTAQADAGVVQAFELTGGVMTAMAADGTTFELTVPGDALFSPVTLAMIPVVLPSNPFGAGPAWGVQLLPDGLSFNSALTLVITPPAGQTPALTQQLPFGWSGPTDEVMLAMRDPADSHLTIKLLHFSSYAYATAMQGASATLAGVRNRIGGSAEARIQSAMAERLMAEHQRQQMGDSEEALVTLNEIVALLEEYVREVVDVRVAAAGSSCAAARLALETILTIQRQTQLLGIEDLMPQYDDLGPIIDAANAVCIEEEWNLCRDEHIVQRIIPVYLGMERQAQLLGIDTAGKVWEAKADQFIRACHTYRLDIDTTAVNTSDQWSMTEAMKGPVKLSLGSAPLLGVQIMSEDPHGPLISQSYSVAYAGNCSGVANIVRHDAQFMTQSLTWELKTDPTQPGLGEIEKFKLVYLPGLNSNSPFGTAHDVIDLCGEPPRAPISVTGLNYWATAVVVLGENAGYFNATDGFFFADWAVHNGSAVLAEKSFSVPYADGALHFSTSGELTLNHTPMK